MWLTLLLALPTAAAPVVQYDNGRFSAQLNQVDVKETLGELARLAQVEIRGGPTAAAERVDVTLRNASLHEALAQLLGGQSFVIFYSGERPRRVVLVRGGAPGALPAAPPADKAGGATVVTSGSTPHSPAAGLPPDPAAPPDAGVDAAGSDQPVTIHGALAQAMGTDSASFSDVTAVAVSDPNPAIRAEALRVGLGIIEDEPTLSDSFLQVLAQRDDASVAAWLRRAAGEHALEIVRQTARESNIEVLRQRAEGIAHHLEAGE